MARRKEIRMKEQRTPLYTTHHFQDLPIGTRFLYRGRMWTKLADDAAQDSAPPEAVHYFAGTVEVQTA